MKNKYSQYKLEAALDEVGRGCLAGPVIAAAIILPETFLNDEINDSKQISEKKRIELEPIIKEHAIECTIGEIDNEQIDKINILNASFMAMHKALDAFSSIPEFLLIDGNKFIPYKNIPFFCAIKGDSKYLNIASASIIAKNYRDSLMNQLHEEFPMYQWNKNKGYPTKEHKEAISKYGISPYHRKSFRLFDINYKLNFFYDL